MTTATLTAPDLQNRLGTDVLRLLDVRTPGEFESTRIPGSYNVPLPVLSRYARRLAERSEVPLVVLCQTGARSRQAAEVLAPHGIEPFVLEGGIVAWQSGGGQVEEGDPKWNLERQVRLTAGGIVLGSIAASTVVPRARYVAGAIGGGLFFAALSNTCLMGDMLGKLPYNRGSRAEVEAAVDELNRTA